MIGSKVGIYSQSAGGGQFAFGNALEFDGVNDYVSLPDASAVIDYSNPFTISMWVKPIDSVVFQRFFCIKNTEANGLACGLSSSAGYSNLYFINQASANARHRVTFAFATGNWYHIAFTYNGSGFSSRSNYKIYVNGTSLTLNAASNFSIGGGVGIELGRQFNGGSQGNKVFDEFALWNNAELTASQITDLYNSGNGQFATTVEPSNLYCYWRLNELSPASTAVDSSGNGNDGTLNNFNTSTCWVPH